MATAEAIRPAPHFNIKHTWHKFLEMIFRGSLDEKKAKEAWKNMKESETKEKREEARRRKEQEDESKRFNESLERDDRATSEAAVLTAKKEQIKGNLDKFIQAQGNEGSNYIYEIVRDTSKQEELKKLVDASYGAASILNEIATKGRELHGNPVALINLSQRLIWEADKVGKSAVVATLLAGISRRVIELIPEAFNTYNAQARAQREVTYQMVGQWLEPRLKIKLTNRQRALLTEENSGEIHENGWKEAIEELVTNVPQRTANNEAQLFKHDADKSFSGKDRPPQVIIERYKEIMDKAGMGEATGSMDPEQLLNIYQEIQRAKSEAFPKDLQPTSHGFREMVQATDNYTKETLERLAELHNKRMKELRPTVVSDLDDPNKFLKAMADRPGHLGILLEANPNMYNLLIGKVMTKDEMKKSIKFRNRVFLTIHQQMLRNKYESADRNFGLYERADFTTFNSVLSSEMGGMRRKETGETVGDSWSEWYVNLSNTIQLCRDIDFWASQPNASMKDLAKSLAMFQNSSLVQAMSIPAVLQAYRAYESTLRGVQEACDGYLPPQLFGYDPMNLESFWDKRSEVMLRNMFYKGVIRDVAVDENGFPIVSKDGNTLEVDPDNPLQIGDEEDDLMVKMYMTLGKGFGIATLRYLEMFANAKVPGSKQPGFDLEGFHSSPYEGPARAMNFFNTVIHKWKFGNCNYFNMMNTLIDGDKKYKIEKTLPMEAYLTWRKGPNEFRKKYGAKAKRLVDLLNFSGISSAFGPPYTGWRHFDSTLGWSDKDRELLGGPARIQLSGGYAGAKVKEYLIVNKYKQEFRNQMAQEGKITEGVNFAKLWKEKGLPRYQARIDDEWDDLQGKNEKGRRLGYKHTYEKYKENYQVAFKARVFVDMAMRNPLGIGHNLTIKRPDGEGKGLDLKLHSFLVEQILHISPEDLKFGDYYENAPVASSIDLNQRKLISDVLELESDLVAVREKAMAENRELQESDFDIIKSKKHRENALEYWKACRKLIIGSLEPDAHEKFYEKIGLKYMQNGKDYDIDWEGKVNNIKHILEVHAHHPTVLDIRGKNFELPILLTEELADKNWDVTWGTDDQDMQKMAILNLGPRQLVRRGGDALAHEEGGNRVGDYLTDSITANPKMEDLTKAFFEIRKAYQPDMIECGWQVAHLLAIGTTKLYAWDWGFRKGAFFRMGSIMQLDIMKTRRNVAAWLANDRRKFVDELEHIGALPPEGEDYFYEGINETYNIHNLRKILNAENDEVWKEILLLGFALALGMTLWNAFTTKDEEEEGGGGGHQ